MYVGMSLYVPVWLGFVIRVSFKKFKSDYNQTYVKDAKGVHQTWVKDAIGVPSYVNEVKGHVQGQRLSEVKLSGKCWFSLFGSSLKSRKSDWNQTWVKDTMRVSLYVRSQRSCTKVKGHLGSTKVENIKLVFFFFFFFLKSWSPITTKLDLWMQHVNSYSVSGWGLVKLSFVKYLMRVTMILQFPASYLHLARRIAQVYLLYFFIKKKAIE